MAKETPGKYIYKYPHPAVTADCVVFGFDGTNLKILLVERGKEPYKGCYALPGGFIRPDETIEECAARELMEETGVKASHLMQYKVYSQPDRDSRERVITVTFIALVRSDDVTPVGGDDAAGAYWFDTTELPPLAFDHDEIVCQAREWLSEIIRIRPVAFTLLNETFTIPELQSVYEAINNTNYDRRNFQRKLLQSGLVEDVGKVTPAAQSRPATLFTASDTLRKAMESLEPPTMSCACAKGNFPANKKIKGAIDRIMAKVRSNVNVDDVDACAPCESDDCASDEKHSDGRKNQIRDLFNF